MRTIGLFALAIFFPVYAYAATLININTADAVLLDTLPGIGPAYATRIVDYRTAHGPFARIEDIQNVSGIGPSTYAGIAPFITVDSSTPSASDPAPVASSTPATPTPSGSASAYVPPPSALSLDIEVKQNAIVEVPLHLTARAMMKGNTVDLSARILWGFGDGSGTEGTVADKAYRYAGTYLVTVTATDGTASAHEEFTVAVRPAQVHLSEVSSTGITITNDASERLDLSDWVLSVDAARFHIPSGTVMLPKASVLFPSSITSLMTITDASLIYPNGVVATRYTPPTLVPSAVMQPSLATTSYEKIQAVVPPAVSSTAFTTGSKVEPIIRAKANIQKHDEAVLAPAAVLKGAAAGAATPSLSKAVAATTTAHATSLFRSPWTLSFLSVMTLAGGAFIFL